MSIFTREGMSTQEIFSELRKRGATKEVVSFSGGNDEGHAESIRLLSGEEVLGDIGQAQYAEPETPDTKLAVAMVVPVYERYGSFAGEFYVRGEVVYDVATGEVDMHGEEETRSWESF